MKNKNKIILLAGCLAVCALGAAAWFYFGNSSTDSSEAIYVTSVGSLTETDMGTLNKYAGVVEPQKTVDVKLDSGRTVKEVKVSEGQEVKAGDVLFEYDTSTSADELAQAQLELEQLKNTANSLQDQIQTLQNEKAKASEDEQLSYTIQIQQAQLDLKKNEYDQKSKQNSVDKLSKASDNSVVTSEIDGIIKSIAELSGSSNSDSSPSPDSPDDTTTSTTSSTTTSFITILGTGAYRVKGSVNEQNMGSLVEGAAVIIRSRVDAEQTWKGVLDSIDTGNPDSSATTESTVPGETTATGETTSSSYPFYVSLESTDGLMLGQHVLIEMDYGQDEQKEGLWLTESYIVDAEGSPYVWAATDRDRLEKRAVTLGEYDAEQGKYEIKEGLTEEDHIAFPAEGLEEGMPTSTSSSAQMTPNAQDAAPASEESISPDGATTDGTSPDAMSPDAEGPVDASEQIESTTPEGAGEELEATSPLEELDESGPSSPAEDPALNSSSDIESEVGPQ